MGSPVSILQACEGEGRRASTYFLRDDGVVVFQNQALDVMSPNPLLLPRFGLGTKVRLMHLGSQDYSPDSATPQPFLNVATLSTVTMQMHTPGVLPKPCHQPHLLQTLNNSHSYDNPQLAFLSLVSPHR